MSIRRDGLEDDSLVGELRTEVLNNDMENMFLVLNTIQDQYPYGINSLHS